MEADLTYGSLSLTLLVICIVAVILSFIKRVLIKKIAYKDGKKKRNTLLGLIFNILQYLVVIIGIFVVLTVNGINVTGLLAGLGVVATIVGLSLQDTFKDLFAGLNIYDNNFYKVGDFVKYNGELCEVKFFNARISKFSSIATGSTFTVSNSTINNIEKVKEGVNIRIFFDFDTDRNKIEKCLRKACQVIEEAPGTKNVAYWGMDMMEENGIGYTCSFEAKPLNQYGIKILFYTTAYDEFKKAKISPAANEERKVKLIKDSKTK